MAGTFNGNPLTMAAMHATLTRGAHGGTRTRTLNHVDGYLKDRLSAVIDRYRLPAYVTAWGPRGP